MFAILLFPKRLHSSMLSGSTTRTVFQYITSFQLLCFQTNDISIFNLRSCLRVFERLNVEISQFLVMSKDASISINISTQVMLNRVFDSFDYSVLNTVMSTQMLKIYSIKVIYFVLPDLNQSISYALYDLLFQIIVRPVYNKDTSFKDIFHLHWGLQ